MEDLFRDLTAAQCEAVRHIDGPLLILAGPGSGKTRVVTHRIANLLAHRVPARQVLALTFTNKAADEMKRRLELLAPGAQVWVGTFHRFCARLLREYAELVGLSPNYTIYDTGDSERALKRALDAIDLDAAHFTPQQIASGISWAKNKLIRAEEYQSRPGSVVSSIVVRVYPEYQSQLLRSNAVDFDDLLLHVAVLLRDNAELRSTLDARYRYILVDEYQDTNLAQYAIVRALSQENPNLSVTGDPDQSIYGWRGADVSNILNFERDYPQAKVVRLEQNYRSTQRILQVASHLIKHNRLRKEKELFTENPQGVPVRLLRYGTGHDEAESIAGTIAEQVRAGTRRPRDFAIFYRTNALSRGLEHALWQLGVPYQLVNGVEFYQRKEIKDVLAYLTLINNPQDDNAFHRIINMPPRGIGRTTIERIVKHASQTRHTSLEAARDAALLQSLAKKAATSVSNFVELIDRLSQKATGSVEELMRGVLDGSGYRAVLAQSSSEEDQDRLANIEELLTAAGEFDHESPELGRLEEFLEEVSLVNDIDAWGAEDDRVTMMTLHAAKGLEFPVVYIMAVEHGLLPHDRAREESEIEEERRLLFVGITRAQQELQLSLARTRDFRGVRKLSVPSPFLTELPLEELEMNERAFDDSYLFGDEVLAAEEGIDMPPPRSPRVPPSPREPRRFSLTTAAEMAGSAVARPVNEEHFEAGMVVRHPEYGLGTIHALSGSGVRRVATVNFAGQAGEKRFILHQSNLKPVKNGRRPSHPRAPDLGRWGLAIGLTGLVQQCEVPVMKGVLWVPLASPVSVAFER